MPDHDGCGSPATETYLCFDFGLARIGIAVGQSLTTSASPLEVIRNDGMRIWRRIEELLDQWQPHALIVGVPLTEDGDEQPMSEAARRFARRLAGRFELPVHEADERHSSREAQQRFRELRAAGSARRRQVAREDAVAAQIILERWMHERAARP